MNAKDFELAANRLLPGPERSEHTGISLEDSGAVEVSQNSISTLFVANMVMSCRTIYQTCTSVELSNLL